MKKLIKEKRYRPFFLILKYGFQLKFTAIYVFSIALAIISFWLTIYCLFRLHIPELHDNTGLHIALNNEILIDVLDAINYIFLWGGIGIVLLFIIFGLIISRWIIGPLYRIEKDLQQFEKNITEIRPLKIRGNDHCQDLVSVLNSVLARLRK